MNRAKESRGFSLVELMIVVAVIAILAAIVIPAFMRFAMKSKTSEAIGNLAAIRTAQEAYKVEYGVYRACEANPGEVRKGADAVTLIAWDTSKDGWADIGFKPTDSIRYSYEVTLKPGGGFIITAQGDLDEDGAVATFTVDSEVATYPAAIRTGDYF